MRMELGKAIELLLEGMMGGISFVLATVLASFETSLLPSTTRISAPFFMSGVIPNDSDERKRPQDLPEFASSAVELYHALLVSLVIVILMTLDQKFA